MIRYYSKTICAVFILCAVCSGIACNSDSDSSTDTGFSVTSATNSLAAAAVTSFNVTFDGTTYNVSSAAGTGHAVIYKNGTSVGVAGAAYDAVTGKKTMSFRVTYTASALPVSGAAYLVSVSVGNKYYSLSGAGGALSATTASDANAYTIHTMTSITPNSCTLSPDSKAFSISAISAVQQW